MEDQLRELSEQEFRQRKQLKILTIREVSNGYLTEQQSPLVLGSSLDIQSSTAIHNTPADVAVYVENFLKGDK